MRKRGRTGLVALPRLRVGLLFPANMLQRNFKTRERGPWNLSADPRLRVGPVLKLPGPPRAIAYSS